MRAGDTDKSIGLSRMILLFFGISFMGWCFEKTARFFVYGSTADRGFLSIPICPIYGFSIIFIYLLIGTPRSPRISVSFLARRRIRREIVVAADVLVYFTLSALISTAAELITGIFFEGALGLRLWSYEAQPYSVGGYICLGYSLLWGALITAFMLTLWAYLLGAVQRIKERCAVILAVVLCVLAVTDLAFNTFYAISSGEHFNFL